MSARLSKKPPSMGRITPSWWSSWLKADLIKFGKVDSKTFWGVGIVVAVLAVYVGYLFWIQYSSGKKATKSSKKAPTAAAKVASPKRERSSSKSKKAASPAPAPSPEKASPDKASPAKASKSRSRSKTPAKKGK